ncbi:MAG: hypothetical protein ACTSVZ_04815 [Promethearchaeota archaeon]
MWFKHLVGILRRYKRETLKYSIYGVLFILLVYFVYPGEDAMKGMFTFLYDSVLGGLFNFANLESPGWILWMTFTMSLLPYYLLAISGINIGAKIIPTVESDGIEIVLAASSYPTRRIYTWNYLTGILAQILILLPLYGISCIFSLYYNTTFILDELAISFIISLGFGIFFLSISSIASILSFRKSNGKIIGFGYLIFGFILDLLVGSLDWSSEYFDVANLSISHYLNPTQVIFLGYSNDNFLDIWEPFMVIVGISAVLFLIGLWRVKYPDFIERVKEMKPENSKTGINPFEKIYTPDSYLARKFPVFMDEFRMAMKIVLLLIFLIGLQQFGLFAGLPSPDELLEQLAQSSSPIFTAFVQNHPIPSSLLGFIILKFYSALWIYFGFFIALIAARIPNRDVGNSTHDIIFANNISPQKLIKDRALSLFFSFSILLWGLFFIIRGIQSTVNFELDYILQAQIFTVLWIHYMGMGIFLIGIALIPLVSKGKSLAVNIFIFFIVLSFIPFMNPNIEFLKYFSYLSYFDPVGMLIGEVSFATGCLTSLIMLGGSCVFTYIMIKFKFSKTDLR